MIELEWLKELVDLMVDNDLSELDLRDQEQAVTIKRGASAPAQPVVAQSPASGGAEQGGASAGASQGQSEADRGDADEGLVAIESPMVGTFYGKPNPDSEPFVSVGSSVGPETVVCLIEAMKVFNEVKAETSGVIERVLVNNGDAVEFGQRLFLVRPS